MHLNRVLIEDWPKLAWCARLRGQQAEVLHGPRVEHGDNWIFEGAWTGDFTEGGFDQTTPAVIGTGLHVRGDTVSMATSMNSVDRLYTIEKDGQSIVSNSLPCLMAISETRLATDARHSKHLDDCFRDFQSSSLIVPTRDGPEIRFHIYDHLLFAAGKLSSQPRTEPAPDFEDFEQYEDYLRQIIEALRDNLRDPKRAYGVAPVATISNGYDSSAAAVIAEPLGLRSALTISRGGVLSHLNDSGESIAQTLDVPIQRTVSTDSGYKDHMLIWAGTGHSYDLNLTLFDYPDDLTLLMVGTHGDIVWQKGLKPGYLDTHHFLDRDATGLGGGEWRLHHGINFAVVPYFGASKLERLAAINASPDMDRWRVGGSYDRPLPRRIVEGRGVGREAFGRRKTRTISRPMYYPNDDAHRRDLARFLQQHDQSLPRRFGPLQRPIDMIRYQLCAHLGWFKPAAFGDLYFVWANEYLAENVYRRA